MLHTSRLRRSWSSMVAIIRDFSCVEDVSSAYPKGRFVMNFGPRFGSKLRENHCKNEKIIGIYPSPCDPWNIASGGIC